MSRKLTAFNSISLDGYFTDAQSDMSWAHTDDPEFNAFVQENAKGGGALLFGRVTYDMMASFWPTPMAMQSMPAVAERMNNLTKYVASRSMREAAWTNTTVLRGDLIEDVRALKASGDGHVTILGSGSIVSQLAEATLIDEFHFVLCPIVLGSGRTMFDGVKERHTLRLLTTRAFKVGKVVLTYAATPG